MGTAKRLCYCENDHETHIVVTVIAAFLLLVQALSETITCYFVGYHRYAQTLWITHHVLEIGNVTPQNFL